MCKSAVVLTCLACVSQGWLLQSPDEHLQDTEVVTKSQDMLGSMRTLAMLLTVHGPPSTFNPSGPAAHFSLGNRQNSPMPVSTLDLNYRLGHSMPMMQMNEEEWMMRETSGEDHFMKKETLEYTRLKFGPEDPRTIDALSDYAVSLSKLGKQSEAEPLMAEALETSRKVLGYEHPDTLRTLNLYADILLKVGLQAEAEPVTRTWEESEKEAKELANAFTEDTPIDSKFCLHVKLSVKPDRRDEFIDCIKNNQKGTLETEPLAVEYVWGEDTETANTFHFYEKYLGKAGFEAHQDTPHFAAWKVFEGSDPFTEPPRVEFYEEC